MGAPDRLCSYRQDSGTARQHGTAQHTPHPPSILTISSCSGADSQKAQLYIPQALITCLRIMQTGRPLVGAGRGTDGGESSETQPRHAALYGRERASQPCAVLPVPCALIGMRGTVLSLRAVFLTSLQTSAFCLRGSSEDLGCRPPVVRPEPVIYHSCHRGGGDRGG